jgi:hypothetical protein
MVRSAKIEAGIVTNVIAGLLDVFEPIPDGVPVSVGWAFSGGTFIAPEPVSPSQGQVIASAHDAIRALAAEVYTDQTVQDRMYANKYSEALRYKDASEPDTVDPATYPYLSAEAAARAVSLSTLADLILSAASSFNAFGASCEAARVEVTNAVLSAEPTARQSAADTIVATLKTQVPT